MDPYPDEEDMEYVKSDEEKEHHWMVSKENYGGLDYKKVVLHANRWDIYLNEK